jgi:hypothetical protein
VIRVCVKLGGAMQLTPAHHAQRDAYCSDGRVCKTGGCHATHSRVLARHMHRQQPLTYKLDLGFCLEGVCTLCETNALNLPTRHDSHAQSLLW